MDSPITGLALPSKKERHRRFGSVDPVSGNKPTIKEQMTDLQNYTQDYLFKVDHVGICQVRHPIKISSELDPKTQTSVATITLSTSLDRQSKGINMSRLTEQLEDYRQKGWTAELTDLCQFARELAKRMDQTQADIDIEFPWFYERSSPVTGKTGLNHSDASIKITYKQDEPITITVGLRVSVTTLCPCSKEISEYSAHNQRGIVTITARLVPALPLAGDWKVMFLEAVESNASSSLHPVLKRPDEKAVTEKAYENPRFVEDMVRLVAADLYEMDFVSEFKVECRNEESIHLHDAIAVITYDKRREEAAR